MINAFDKNMQIITGNSIDDTKEKNLSKIDKKKISDAYFKLFFNLTYTNWLRGKNLGESWYTSLNQLEQYVKNKKSDNVAALYLRQIFAAHKTRWSQIMMTHENRDDFLNPTPEQKKQWLQDTARNITSAMNTLNKVIKEFSQSNQSANINSSKKGIYHSGAEKIQMLIMMQLKQNQKH